MFITDHRVRSHNLPFEGVDYYMTRAVDGTIFSMGGFLSIYVKFGRFIFYSILNGRGANRLKLGRVHPIKGEIPIPTPLNDKLIGNILYNRIAVFNKIEQPSTKQQGIIEDTLINSLDFNSDLGKSLMQDSAMDGKNFGDL